jgi:hypothetical protein
VCKTLYISFVMPDMVSWPWIWHLVSGVRRTRESAHPKDYAAPSCVCCLIPDSSGLNLDIGPHGISLVALCNGVVS